MILLIQKFLPRAIILIAILISVALIVGNIFAIRLIISDVGKPTETGPFYKIPAFKPLTRDHIIAIATVITPTAVVIVNIWLVVITMFYAHQTEKMVDFHYQTRKADLSPLFIPQEYGYKQTGNKIYFEFINAGNVALYVNMYLGSKRICFTNHLDPWETVNSITFDKSDLMKKDKTNELQTIIWLTFWDKALNKYKQFFRFDWDREEFVFNNSCLPIDQKQTEK